MSIYGALFTGVSGLAAQSNAIGIISDNIANVNTTGYKGTQARFSTVVAQSGIPNLYNPGGVRSFPLSNIDTQGQLQGTASATDLAVVGNGFFVVSDRPATGVDTEFLFTRAGSFRPDAQGNLVNTAGYFLRGYPLSSTGSPAPTSASTFAGLETVNINNLSGTAQATTSVELGLNLPSTGTSPVASTGIQQQVSLDRTAATSSTYNVTTQIYDDLGNTHDIVTTYTKTATANEWTVSVAAPAGGTIASGTSSGTITFDAASGLPTALPTLNPEFTFPTGASNQVVAFNLGTTGSATGVSQIGTANATSLTQQTGGTLPSIETATIQVFDNLGNAHNINLNFRKTGPNAWAIEAENPTLNGSPSGTVDSSTRSITFTNGLPGTIVVPPLAITWNAAIGASPSLINLDVGTPGQTGNLTQFAGNFRVARIEQNGIAFGNFRGVNISEEGVVQALFDNGQQLDIYQLALGIFPNPNGLERRTGNAYSGSIGSGDFLINNPGIGGTGTVAASSLEASNIDLAEEFTNMIITQRAYSASSKVITTADEMLDELIRIIR
ncbi:flagellar hook protein FlgE [Kiloniella sp. b19]|uniref:flagellar hook protein FlgE n=1 Tax=Kiloniella sp. GXU_MW_B19 TaxID=3141326 RepID=UPI0031D9397C